MSNTVQEPFVASVRLRDSASARYRVLLASCLLTFGSYYCFDMPSVLEDQLTYSLIGKASFAKEDPATFYQLFYLVYAWTNMGMSLLAGVLVDRWGLEPSVFLFLFFCVFGQAMYALGPTLGGKIGPDAQYTMMFAGRFIFGLGGGAITIAQNAISAYWFEGRELAMAFGCTLTISRLGSVINFNLTTRIFNSFFAHLHADADDRVFCAPNSTTNPWITNSSATIVVNGTAQVAPAVIDACRGAIAYTFWLGDALIVLSFGAATFWLAMHRAELRSVARLEATAAQSMLDDLRTQLFGRI